MILECFKGIEIYYKNNELKRRCWRNIAAEKYRWNGK